MLMKRVVIIIIGILMSVGTFANGETLLIFLKSARKISF